MNNSVDCISKEQDLNSLKCRNSPLISVIIPTHNRYDYLINAISSVASQTYNNIELIIVNDGSTDSSYKVLKNNIDKLMSSLEKKLNNIKIIELEKSSKEKLGYPCGAVPRNEGIANATGEFIAFLDDDDIWLPDKLEIQMNEMLTKNYDFSATDSYIGSGFYDPNKHYKIYNAEHYKDALSKIFNINGSLPNVFDYNFVSIHNPIITSSVVISKELCNKIGKMELIRNGGAVINGKRDWQDWNYWRRALKYCNCLYINQPLLYYDTK